MAAALQGAKDAGIPVLTWDSDLLPDDKDAARRLCRHAQLRHRRQPRQAGAWQIKPKGGTICIQSGGAAAANHNERMQGIRDTLAGKTEHGGARRPADRPERLERSRRLPALHQRRLPACRCSRWRTSSASIRTSTPSSPTGGFPQFVPDAYREGRREVQGQDRRRRARARRRRHAAGADRPDEGGPVARARSASGRSRWATRRCTS